MIKRFFTNVGVFLIILGIGGGYGAREFLSSHKMQNLGHQLGSLVSDNSTPSTYQIANFFNEFGYHIAAIGVAFLVLGLLKRR